jgi:hypothetical protein
MLGVKSISYLFYVFLLLVEVNQEKQFSLVRRGQWLERAKINRNLELSILQLHGLESLTLCEVLHLRMRLAKLRLSLMNTHVLLAVLGRLLPFLLVHEQERLRQVDVLVDVDVLLTLSHAVVCRFYDLFVRVRIGPDLLD